MKPVSVFVYANGTRVQYNYPEKSGTWPVQKNIKPKKQREALSRWLEANGFVNKGAMGAVDEVWEPAESEAEHDPQP